jgi:diaminopimelate epimerase
MNFPIEFTKMSGTGNDFIIIDHRRPFLEKKEMGAFAKAVCRRKFSVGADGLILLEDVDGADFRWHFYNGDGSEAEMCGNGVRMVARKLKMEGSIDGDTVLLDTGAGEIVPKLGDGYSVTVDMGIARFGGEKLVGVEGDAVEASLHAAGRSFVFTFVDVGNPHAVIQSPWPLELVPLHEIGPVIEEHRFFPRKANVEFVKVLSEHEAKVRVWERGVGETRACGTGATATAVALVRTGRCSSPVTVELPGGKLEVEVKPDWRVFMTGPAEEIYHGDLSLEFLRHLE